MQSVPEDTRQGAVRREWPLPFSRTATPDWILWDAPFGRAGKRSPAVLHLWARAKAIPGEARLALNRFPTRCIRSYYLDRVLVLYPGNNYPAERVCQDVHTPVFHVKHDGVT